MLDNNIKYFDILAFIFCFDLDYCFHLIPCQIVLLFSSYQSKNILNVLNISIYVACKHWDAPNNASLICVNESDKDSINCTLTCNEGFDFDSPPRDYYYCGPSTFHLWEFETDDNPTKRVPSCNGLYLIMK